MIKKILVFLVAFLLVLTLSLLLFSNNQVQEEDIFENEIIEITDEHFLGKFYEVFGNNYETQLCMYVIDNDIEFECQYEQHICDSDKHLLNAIYNKVDNCDLISEDILEKKILCRVFILGDISVCNEISDVEGLNDYESSIFFNICLTLASQDESKCDLIEDIEDYNFCIDTIYILKAISQNNLETCYMIDDFYSIIFCKSFLQSDYKNCVEEIFLLDNSVDCFDDEHPKTFLENKYCENFILI